MYKQIAKLALLLLSGCFLAILAVFGQPLGPAGEPSLRELLDLMAARQKRTFTANVSCRRVYLNQRGEPDGREERWKYKLLRGDGMVKWTGTYDQGDQSQFTRLFEEAFDGDLVQAYTHMKVGVTDVTKLTGVGYGQIGIAGLDEAAGHWRMLTEDRLGGWLHGEDIFADRGLVPALLTAPDDALTLHKVTNEEGKELWQLDALLDIGAYTLYFNPEIDYNLVKMNISRDKKTHAGLARLGERYFEKMECAVSNIRYTKIDGTWFPISGELDRRSKVPEYPPDHTICLIELADVEFLEEQPKETFQIQWPEGCVVYDTRVDAKLLADAEGELVSLTTQRQAGKQAPELAVAEWVNGKPVTLETLRGEIVLLAFSDYTDEACADLVPLLNELLSKYSEVGLEVISVHSSDAELSWLQQFLSNESIEYRVAIDKPSTGGSYKGATFEKYRVNELPAIFIMDAEGKVRYQDIPLEAVEEAVRRLLNEE